jgi:flagellin
MGMTINTNLSALNAYRNLSNTQSQLSTSLERLSSGLRINHAADDAAGLSISQGLKSQVSGLGVAAQNAQDGVSVVQTAEGGLSEVQSILQRMRDLAVQAGNDSNNSASRTAISTEATSLTSELGRIAKSTNFNGINLLDGSASTLHFQVGAAGNASSQISVDLSSANVSAMATSLTTTTGTSFSGTAATVAGAQTFTVTNGSSTTAVNVTLGTAGTYTSMQNVADALNKDASFSGSLAATVDTTGNLLVSSKNGGTVATTAPGTGITAGTATAAGLDYTSASGAQAAINTLDTQIAQISSARSNIGAAQNRFQHAINTVNVAKENLTASMSRITDVDMASEMVNFTRANLLSQAGTAMLAQANQSNQGVLKLLQ